MSDPLSDSKRQPGIVPAAFFGCCPRCQARNMFDGPVKFADRCTECGLDYSRYNVGDGPAAFLTMVIGAIVVALALFVEFSFDPPFLVHVLLWVPITAALTIVTLRWTKGALLITEHHRDAAEGQLSDNRQDERN